MNNPVESLETQAGQYTRPTDEENLRETTREKLAQMSSAPGMVVEFDPEEADLAGAFEEDALSDEDALEARFDDQA